MNRIRFACCFRIFGSAVLLAAPSARAEIWRLSNANLEVTFDDQSAVFSVQQQTTGRKWQQVPPQPRHTVDRVERRDGQLNIKLKGTPDLDVVLRLASNSDLEVEIAAPAGTKIQTLSYPGPLETPGNDWHLVFPLSEGVLLPISEVRTALPGRGYDFYGMGGAIMPWVGVTDPSLQAGYIFIVDTPFDAGLRFSQGESPAAPEPVWKAEMGAFGYVRKLRYHFFDRGGYVAQAKHYREHVRRTREFSTLRERAQQRPQIDRLVGAVHIYTWDDGRTAAFARELKQAGIERAWVGWDPSHPPYPDKGIDETLKQLGYLAGVYDLYRDCYDDVEWDRKAATDDTLRAMWLHRYPYPGLFQKIVARGRGNEPMAIRISRDVGLMRYWTCTKAQAPYVSRRMTRELQTYPHDSVFIDVTLAATPFECQSPDHPMTRREDAAARLAIHQFMANDLKLVVGSEWGADYGIAHTEFLHGVMTLHNFYGEGVRDPASPHYHGDWRNPARPTMMLGETKPTDPYRKYGVGEYYRVPLFELVFHDCAVSSWRWDDNSHKQPDAWAKKDLLTALYAVAPQWNLDLAMWEKHRARFIASYQAIAPVLRAVGYDEMTDHRFLTADRKLQETSFSSGRKVIANFGDTPRKVGTLDISAGSFVLSGN